MKYLSYGPFTLAAIDTNQTSSPILLTQIFKVSVQATFTATATGTFKIQVSNDEPDPSLPVADQTFTNWSDLGSAVNITGAGVNLIAQQDVCYRAMRVVYTDTSGGTSTGKMTVRIMALSA